MNPAVIQNLFRWKEGPVHNSVIKFHEPKDRNDLYAACKEGLKKTGLVMTEDSRFPWILTNSMDSDQFFGFWPILLILTNSLDSDQFFWFLH